MSCQPPIRGKYQEAYANSGSPATASGIINRRNTSPVSTECDIKDELRGFDVREYRGERAVVARQTFWDVK